MKYIFLVIAVLSISANSIAQNWVKPTPAEMNAERQKLTLKTSELESSLTKHQTNAAEVSANNLLFIMKSGVAQTRSLAENSGAQKEALIKRMLELEQMVADFMKLSTDVTKNGTQLIQTAKAFQAKLPG
jgi:hypothetical protein